MTTPGIQALNFGADHNPNASNYGGCYWMAGLNDGREVAVMADRVEISPAGALTFIREMKPGGSTSTPCIPCDAHITLILAPGQWVHCYAANCITGDPVAIAHIPPVAAHLPTLKHRRADQ